MYPDRAPPSPTSAEICRVATSTGPGERRNRSGYNSTPWPPARSWAILGLLLGKEKHPPPLMAWVLLLASNVCAHSPCWDMSQTLIPGRAGAIIENTSSGAALGALPALIISRPLRASWLACAASWFRPGPDTFERLRRVLGQLRGILEGVTICSFP